MTLCRLDWNQQGHLEGCGTFQVRLGETLNCSNGSGNGDEDIYQNY